MEPKFIVDFNAGRLAKWLRVMGYDTMYVPGIEDRDLVRIAQEEGRVIVTKDSHILERRPVVTKRVKAVHIQRDDLIGQIEQVTRDLGLNHANDFSRCIRCNEPLAPVEKEAVRDQVPPYVFQTQQEFMECLSCHRLYWRGTHWRNMRAELEKVRQENGE